MTLIVYVVSFFGAVASIIALQDPTRMYVVFALLLIVAAYSAFLYGRRSSGSIRVFKRRPPQRLEEELSDAKEVLFAWHTGTVKLAEGDLFNQPRKIRMILVHPDSEALKEIAKIAHLTAVDMASGIKALSRKVKETGGDVRWFNGPIGNSTIIADPDAPHGWARVEFLIPYLDPASRPSIRVSKAKDPALFGSIRQCFEKLWENSREPEK